jgi:hypothetical protein
MHEEISGAAGPTRPPRSPPRGRTSTTNDRLQTGQTRVAAKVETTIAGTFFQPGKAMEDRRAASLALPGRTRRCTRTSQPPTSPAAAAAAHGGGLLRRRDRGPLAGSRRRAAGATSFLRIREIGTGDLAAGREMTSAADFLRDGPAVFRFPGLAPGTYIAFAGVTDGGSSVALETFW